MLETILTRIILRFANRFICDTLHTDTFSLWGGDLVVQNFELQTREVARDALAAVGLRLVRGFVRELRVHVPWNKIRSQSLRVEVDAVEVVFATQLTSDELESQASQERMPQHAASAPKQVASQGSLSPSVAAAAPTAPPSQEGLDEANETWLQPLLRTIMGNVTVVANNLVAKLPQSGAVACLTVAKLDSRPTSSRWEAGFNAVKGPQPMLYRVVSVRDITVTLDHLVPVERRWAGGSLMRRVVRTGKAGARASRHAVELPVFNRVSIEVLVEFPLLPWPGPVNPPPACRVDVHLSPIRAQLSHDQTQLLMRLLRPEVRQTSFSSGGFDDESDCISDRASMSGPGRLHSWTSEPSTTATAALPERSPGSAHAAPLELPPEGCSRATSFMIGSQASSELETGTDAEVAQELRPAGSGIAATLASAGAQSASASGADQNEAVDLQEKNSKSTESGGLRGLLTDVLFGDDDDEFDDEHESTIIMQRETRKSLCLAVCVPLLAFSFEQFRDTENSREAGNPGVGGSSSGGPFGLWEGSWLCTLSLIGLSALVVKPPRGEDSPLEGSVELHHVALQTPNRSNSGLMVAFAWGSPLARSPLDADEALPTTIDSSARAQAWSNAGRRLLADGTEFPHPSHCIFIEAPSVPEGSSVGGQAALRVGLLQAFTPVCNDCNISLEENQEAAEDGSYVQPQVQVNRASVQMAKLFINVEASWLSAAKDALSNLASVATGGAPRHASHRRSAPTSGSAAVNKPAKPVLEAVVSCAGVHVTFDNFYLEVGQSRMDWRQRPHGLDEAVLATKLRETTVFVSSVFAHLVWHKLAQSSRASTSQHGSLAFLRISMVRLQQKLASECDEESEEGLAQLLHLQEIVSVAAKPTDFNQKNGEPGIAHLEVALAYGSFTAGLCPIVSLLCSVDDIASLFTSGPSLVTSARLRDATKDGRSLTLEIRGIHCVSRTEDFKHEESTEFGLKTALCWAGSSAARRGDDQFAGFSSDSEADEVPVLEHVPPAWCIAENVLRTRQFAFFVRRVHVSFSDGQAAGCVILAPYDLRAHSSLLDTLASSAPEGKLSGLPRDSMFSVICQLCPVAPPGTRYEEPPIFEAVMPPAEGLFGADRLHQSRQCCYVWMHAVHVQVDPSWVDFIFALAEAVLPVKVPKKESEQEARLDMKQANDKEGLASAVLCSISGAMLPISVWLTLPNRPTACVTLPLIIASEPHLRASGFCVDVFDGEIVDGPVGMPRAATDELLQPLPYHTLQRLNRCFSLSEASETDSDSNSMDDACLALSRLVGTTLRSESHTKGRPEVSLAANLNLAPLRWFLRPSHLGSLLSWGRSFQIGARTIWARRTKSKTKIATQEMQEQSEPRPSCSTKSNGSRISVSVRATASVSGTFEIQKGSFCFQVPGVTGAFRHVADASQPRTSLNLRLARPHAVTKMPPIPSFDIVEWCEETVHGDDSVGSNLNLQSYTTATLQRRSAYWLVINLRKRGSLPLELSVSTLPLGLCLSLVSLSQLASALAAEVSDVKAAGATAASSSESTPNEEELIQMIPESSPPSPPLHGVETNDRPTNNNRRMCVQVSLNAVSVRLFAGSPFEARAPHLAICVAEAAGRCTREEAFSACAVISVSLFKQPDEELSTFDAVPAPVCLVDDFLRPCTVKFSERLPAAGCTARSKRLEADVIHIDLVQRANFCTFLLIGNRYIQSFSSLMSGAKAKHSAESARVAAPDVERKSEQLNLLVESVVIQVPGHKVSGKESINQLALEHINCTSTGYGISRHSSFQCGNADARLADHRQSFGIANVSVAMISSSTSRGESKNKDLDVTVSIDGGISMKLCTGHLKSDLSSLTLTKQEQQHVVPKPSALHEEFAAPQSVDTVSGEVDVQAERHASSTAPVDVQAERHASSTAPAPTEVRKSSKWRLLLNRIDALLTNDTIDACSFSVNVLNLSIFSWPAAYISPPIEGPASCGMHSSQVDVSIEALSAVADGPRVASAPLLSPLSVNGSVVTLTPVDGSSLAQARTEVRFHSSPVLISAGAWQLRLLTNVFSCKKPRPAGESSSEEQKEKMNMSTVANAAETHGQSEKDECTGNVQPSISVAESSISSTQHSANPSGQEASAQHSVSGSLAGTVHGQHDHECIVMELLMDQGGGHTNLAMQRGLQVESASVMQIPVLCSVLLEELEPWQAVKLPEDVVGGCPRCAIRLDRPAYVCAAACDWQASSNAPGIPQVHLPLGLQMPGGFTALLPGVDFDVEAWDDAQSRFVDVTNATSGTARDSNLIALRLRALAEKPYFRLLVYAATSSGQKPCSELLVNVSIPRLSWSILNSDTVCLAPSCGSVPPLEESFGTLSFHQAAFSFWKANGEGMVVHMNATKTSVELYDMSTLSLAEVVQADENLVDIRLQIAQNAKPSLVPLQNTASRSTSDRVGKPVLDVVLGTWHVQLPPWTMARLASLVNSLARAWAPVPQTTGTSMSDKLSCRLPMVLQNGLPVPLIFGQVSTSEAIPLPSGHACGYAWRHADPTKQCLQLALDSKAPQSAPIPLGHLQVDTKVVWARLELWTAMATSSYAINLCIQRVSREQYRLIILPALLLVSYIPWDVEFDVWQEGQSVPSNTNEILSTAEFLDELPLPTPHRADTAEASNLKTSPGEDASSCTKTVDPIVLSPGKLIGILPTTNTSVWVRFRRPSHTWGPQLPLSTEFMEPYTTMLPFSDQATGEKQNVMCKCADLWGTPRDTSVWRVSQNEPLWLGDGDSGYSPTCVQFRAPEDAPLPNLLQLWPLLTVRNGCPFAISVCVSSMGTADVSAGGCKVLEAAADPRRVTAIELRVFLDSTETSGSKVLQPSAAADAPAEMFSSGPLLVSSLTQFSHSEADENVSWCNSIRCKSVFSTEIELMLLVELRRCKLSGVIRSIMVQPMWTFHNETGEDVLIAAAADQDTVHVATHGHSVSTVLGKVQNDPSFPFVAKFGFRPSLHSPTAVWSDTAQRCPMGQTTHIEMQQGSSCFVALVSISTRHVNERPGSQKNIGGGVHVHLFAAAYVRSKVDVAMRISVGTDETTEVHVPATIGEEGLIPWSRWPSSDAARIQELRNAPTGNAAEGSSTVMLKMRLDDDACSSDAWSRDVPLSLSREKGVNIAGESVKELVELLVTDSPGSRLCSGYVHDVQLDAVTGRQASILVNVAFHVHAQGCFVLTVLRCLQPPLLCANLTEYAAWVANAWRDTPETPSSRGHCIAPAATMEIACPLLRSMEVFPPSGSSAHDAAIQRGSEDDDESTSNHVRTIISLDPDLKICDPIEITLTADADISWPLFDGGNLLVIVRYASGVCRIELRSDTTSLPLPPPQSSTALPLVSDIYVQVADLVVHLCARGSAAGQKPGRHLTFHASGVRTRLRMEKEISHPPLGRDAASRKLVEFHADLLSLADVCRPMPAAPMKQVLAAPPIDLEIQLCRPPYGLPTSYELVRASLPSTEAEQSICMVCLDDSFIQAAQFLVAEIAAEFAVGSQRSSGLQPGTHSTGKLPSSAAKEFQYIFLKELAVSQVPLYIDLQLSTSLFVSFTGLSITFPETRLVGVAANSFVLGQELLAHCIAFLLLNSPMLLGSCDLLGNPVQAYRHVRDGLSDLFHRPLREGFRSLARHLSSASLTSVSAVSDSIRRNLPATPSSPPAVAPGEGGLGAGLRALAGGVGRGLSGILYWEQHTPNREGALGQLRGARNALTGAVAEPVGGLLDLVTSTARGWSAPEASVAPAGPHPADCPACLGCWPLRPELDVSPYKFHLQCCQGLPPPGSLPALLFWSPRCELVRVDGVGGTGGHFGGEPNLRLIRAGLLLTTTQLCVLVDEDTARVLDIGAVQAVEEARGRPFSLVTIASTAGIIWQLHVRGEPGEFVAHLRRARRLAGVPPGAV